MFEQIKQGSTFTPACLADKSLTVFIQIISVLHLVNSTSNPLLNLMESLDPPRPPQE